jgi:hypothetical protein
VLLLLLLLLGLSRSGLGCRLSDFGFVALLVLVLHS